MQYLSQKQQERVRERHTDDGDQIIIPSFYVCMYVRTVQGPGWLYRHQ